MNPPLPGTKIKCPNPEHDDTNPSCHVYEDGLYCFTCKESFPLEQGGKFATLNWDNLNPNLDGSKEVARYEYWDEHGTLIKTKVRFEPKSFKWEGDGSAVLPYQASKLGGLDTIYLVEGEKTADLMWELGLPATCTGFGATWKPELGSRFGTKSVVILPDNDDPGQRFAQAVQLNLTGQVKIVNLPGLGPKEDPWDWFQTHTVDEFLEIVSQDYPTPIEPLLIERVSVVKARETVDPEQANLYTYNRDKLLSLGTPEWLIPGFLQKQTLAQLAGPSEGGKSLWTINTLLSLTSKTDTRVLYLAAEGLIGISGRIQAWEHHNNRKWDETKLRFRSDVPLFGEEEHFSNYLQVLQRTGPWDLVVIDTLARAIPGMDENSAEVMGVVTRASERIKMVTGGGVLLIHHFGWDGNRQRGSSALYGACDNVIYLNTEGEEPNRLIRLHSEKLKDGVKAEDTYYEFLPVGPSVVLRETTPGAHRETQVRRAIREFLSAQSDWVSSVAVTEGVGFRRETVIETLGVMRDEGLVETSPGTRNAILWRLL